MYVILISTWNLISGLTRSRKTRRSRFARESGGKNNANTYISLLEVHHECTTIQHGAIQSLGTRVILSSSESNISATTTSTTFAVSRPFDAPRRVSPISRRRWCTAAIRDEAARFTFQVSELRLRGALRSACDWLSPGVATPTPPLRAGLPPSTSTGELDPLDGPAAAASLPRGETDPLLLLVQLHNRRWIITAYHHPAPAAKVADRRRSVCDSRSIRHSRISFGREIRCATLSRKRKTPGRLESLMYVFAEKGRMNKLRSPKR